MKGRRKIGFIATLALACSLFAVGGIGLSSANKVSAATLENLYIMEEYSANKVFTIPQAKMNVDGTVVDAEYAYLVFPSGKATDKSPVVLDEEGLYELVYTATVNGKQVKATEDFTVAKEIYKVGNQKSTAYYGSDPALPMLEGVVVNLVNGDEFIYDEIIDLSDNTANDPLIQLSTTTASAGNADVGEIVIRFTDIYEESNYIAIHIKNVAHQGDWAVSQSYVTVGAYNQIPGGWENATPPKFHTNNEFGFPVTFSMSGIPYNSTKGYDLLTLSYDEANKKLYTSNQIYPGANMVADLNDRECFLNSWEGFSSSKVRMSISGVDYKTESMLAVITEIDGKAPAQSINTDVEPLITVDADESNLPYALVGKTYKLFEAEAFDTHDGFKDVAVHVYSNYGKENQTVCNVIDGKFIPNRAGVYTIVYTAVDNVGQTAEKVINVEAVEGDGLSFELEGLTEKGYTGREIALFSDVVCENVSGEASYKVEVDGEEVLPENGKYTFFPMKDGTYTVTVTVSDYVQEAVKTFEFKTIKNYTPEIFEDIVLPKYLIQGEEIKLPDVSGYDFSSGKAKEIKAEVFVKENGGEEKAVTDNLYAPSQEGEVEIIYRVAVSNRKAERKVTAKVVSVYEDETLHIENYFKKVSGDVVVGAEDGFVSMTATQKSSVEFINQVQVKDFYFTFVVDEAFYALNKVNVYLTDVVDPSKQLKFTYSRNLDGSAAFSINDGIQLAVDSSFTTSKKNFLLKLTDGVAYGSSTIYSAVNEYLDGSEYKGFSGDKANLTIEMAGVSGKSVLCLKNLNRQSLNNANKDRFAPQILVNTVTGDRKLNETIVLEEAFAVDVLCNSHSFGLTVTDPNGKFVVAQDGTTLNGVDNDPSARYEIKLSVYGEYCVEYKSVDSNGKENLVVYYLTVKDDVAPEISLGAAVVTAKVGETVKVAEFTATDNVSKDVSSFICVDGPDGVYTIVKDNQFVAEKAGKYIVKYMVWDEAGNYTFKSYTVTVR